MRNKLASITLLSALVFTSARAVEINFTSQAFEIGKDSGGSVLTSGYTFALGSFNSFIPTSLNLSSWSANFTVVPTSGTIAWDETFTQFSGAATLSSNAGAFATSNQGYIWGYNSLTIGSTTEWVLLTNSAWTFPVSSTVLPVGWAVENSGTTAIFGTLAAVGNDPFIATAATASAIPEPSTYAAIFGAMALGFVAYRRRATRLA